MIKFAFSKQFLEELFFLIFSLKSIMGIIAYFGLKNSYEQHGFEETAIGFFAIIVFFLFMIREEIIHNQKITDKKVESILEQ